MLIIVMPIPIISILVILILTYFDFPLCANSFIQSAILITPILVMQVSIMSILVMPFLTMPIRFMLILSFSRLELVLSILVPCTNLSKTCSPLS